MLIECVKDQLWVVEYPVQYAGTSFPARMTVVRLRGGELLLHSPCALNEHQVHTLKALGPVSFIFAPGNYHYFYVEAAQKCFPDAKTYICPGIEQKLPHLSFDGFLPEARFNDEFEQCLVRGSRYMWEVALLHKASQSLLLVDVIENIGDTTQGINWALKVWWKVVFRMWNKARPAPEYRMGWKDKKAAAHSLQRILSWDFQRIILAHGTLIDENPRHVAENAWKSVLEAR